MLQKSFSDIQYLSGSSGTVRNVVVVDDFYFFFLWTENHTSKMQRMLYQCFVVVMPFVSNRIVSVVLHVLDYIAVHANRLKIIAQTINMSSEWGYRKIYREVRAMARVQHLLFGTLTFSRKSPYHLPKVALLIQAWKIILYECVQAQS